MKKLLSLFLFALLTHVAAAQVSKTVNVTTAGTLSTLLTATEKTTVTNLTLTGNIDARDVKYLRDQMTVLAVLDMSGVTINEYNGYDGTHSVYTRYYPANKMPEYSFSNSSTFNGKTTLRSIALPNSLTTIGDRAFYGCGGLTNLTIGNSVTSIGNYAFYSCYYLSVIHSQNATPPALGSIVFSSPTVVYVPSSGVSAYKAAAGWSTFTIATEKRVTVNVPTAGTLASALVGGGFGPLASITHLTVTGNLNSVDIAQMKTNMTVLTDIDLSGATLVDNTVPPSAFQGKTTLTAIKLPASLSTISDNAFSGCTNLPGSIPLTPALTSIGNYAFSSCISLTGDLVIPNTVTTIGNYAFSGCTGLNGTLTIGNAVTSIGNMAFQSCSRLNGTLTIPGTVTSIGTNAFQDCSGFTGTLTIPNSVTSMRSYAFSGCTGFTGTLILSNALTSIPDFVFSGCTGISGDLNIPLSVTSIGTYAFQNCSKITGVNISKNTATIGDYAFNGCSSLAKVTVPRSVPPTIGIKTFTGVNYETCTLEVPTGAALTYQIADYWNLFINVTEKDMAESYGITIQTGAGGSIKENNVALSNGSVLMVTAGATKTFTITPNAGYEVANLTYNGQNIKSQLVNNQYTTAAVNANATISVTYQKILYKISIQTGGAGAVNFNYEYGATPAFDFTPSAGSKIQSVTYNGQDVTGNLEGNVYTLPAITANGTLVVKFTDVATGTTDITGTSVKVYPSQSEIIIEGTTSGETVAVYTTNGMQVKLFKSNGQRLTVPVEQGGVYLVKTAGKTFKVTI